MKSLRKQHRPAEDIAIIGMACLFPGAPDLQTYWQNITGKVCSIGEPPPGWAAEEIFDPQAQDPDRVYCRKGGFLGDLACFDPTAYGVMPRAVDGAEPEHFLALRVAHEALQDAGYMDRPFNRQKAGVILGRGTFLNRGNVTALQHGLVLDQTLRLLKQLHPEYQEEELRTIRQQLKASLPTFNTETAPGLVSNVMCGRIANRLDLQGPTYAVDAACASSLIAIDLGVRDLQSGRCDLALVGGVSVSTPPIVFMVFCQLGALSRRGEIRPFDAAADGTLLGEGIGMVVLKRLQEARRDGDRVYAVIKGVGVASDGRALAVLAPRLEGEELALRRAYEETGIAPGSVGLIEAHGTGTSVGDLTEIQALRRVFGDRKGPYPQCALGSVKSMISHTIPAAGIAGLIKAALALYHKTLPPTLGCETPNPKFELEKAPFYLNTETRPWIHGAREPRRAGVSAFGFGGINAHVILEEAPGHDESTTTSYQGTWDTEVIILQAESRADLLAQGECLRQYLSASPDVRLRDIAYTVNTELRDGTLRLAIVAGSVDELSQKLTHALPRLADPSRKRVKDISGIYFFEAPLAREGQLAFLFPGEGAQYPNMLADLCLHFPEVRRCFDRADRVFLDNKRPYVPSQVVFPPPLEGKPGEAALWQVDIAVASVFSANRALATLLSRLGVKPEAVVGHSSGEYAALLTAGVVEVDGEEELLQHGLALNNLYAAVEGRIPAAVLVAVGAVRPGVLQVVMEQCPGPLYMAMDNCPHQVVLCGTEESADKAMALLRSRGAICNVLPFRRGYHTPWFAPISGELDRFFRKLRLAAAKVPLYSCATAGLFPAVPEEMRRLVVSQWSSPVRFRETIEAMWAAGVRIFVDVGPRGNLIGFVDDILRGKSFMAVPLNVAQRSGITQLHHAIGLLAAQGVEMQLDCLYERRQPRRLDLLAPEGGRPAQKPSMRVALTLPAARIDHVGIGVRRIEATSGAGRTSLVAEQKSEDSPERGESVRNSRVSQPGDRTARPRDVQGGSEASLRIPSVGGEGAGNIRTQVMQNYLRTMENFLEVQEQVVQAFLGRAVADMALPGAQPAERHELQPVGFECGHSPVQGEGTPRDALPVSVAPPVSGEQALGEANEPNRETLVTRFLTLVGEKTGYPLEMLDLSLNMEADLGIDSIKRIEILASFQKETGLIGPEELEHVVGLKTLGEVVAHFSRYPVEVNPTPASVDREPNGIAPAGVTPPVSRSGESAKTIHRPFVQEVRSLVVGEEAVVVCHLDAQHHLFLRHHTIGGRISAVEDDRWAMPVVPLTISLEIMAEAATLLRPGEHLIEMKNVRAARWFALENDRRSVVIHARRVSPDLPHAQGAVEVRIDEANEPGSSPGQLIIQGTMIFAEQYPAPPRAGGFTLGEEQPYGYPPDDFYKKVMFHGPLFQSVLSLDRCGEDGAQATVRSGKETGFSGSMSEAGFVLDPVFLDAAGQLVGFWAADRLDRGFVVFPTGFASLRLYGSLLTAPPRTLCRARSRPLGDDRVRSDIEFIDTDGRSLVQIKGWEDARFDFPRAFVHFVLNPAETRVSELWAEVGDRLAAESKLICCRLRQASLPAALFESGDSVWQQAWARLILGRREYEQWQTVKMSEKRRTDWFLGRLAAKDAVRQLLRDRKGVRLCPADIEIIADEYGAPVVQGTWTETLGRAPVISLAHSHGIAVAVAAESGAHGGIGIDIETVREFPDELMTAAFNAEERALLSLVEPTARPEWALRFWCAKEALGKALGRGLVGGPLNAAVQTFENNTGEIMLTLSQRWVEEVGMRFNAGLRAWTMRDRDLIVACVIVHQSTK